MGVLYLTSCPEAIDVGSGKLVYFNDGYTWVRHGQPLIPPPPNPGEIAQLASGQMTAQAPAIHFGPDASKLAVKVPIWLWIDAPAPLSLTVAIRGLSVTVTAAMKTTTWSMGEPINPAQPAIQLPPFTCQGPGTPAPTNPPVTTKPPCGYTYTWKSLPNRTNGTSTWEVTATTNWDVTWTASNGTNGKLEKPLTPSTTTHITIGEWRSTLINGPSK